jgi:hypothetical protein
MGKRKTHTSNLAPTDTVVLYPSFAQLVDDGRHWRIAVQGAVFEDGQIGIRKRMLIRLLGRVMQASPEDIDSPIFQERIRCFTAETERGKRVRVRVGSQSTVLRKGTRRNGQFEGAIRVPVEEAAELLHRGTNGNGNGGDGWIRFEVLGADPAAALSHGEAQLLHETGLSVITDIDDTIKKTDVTSRRELLANTFLREFRPIDGMAALYRRWAECGAAFHYVSSSPWQLYEPLRALCDAHGFPSGSFHLRAFRLRDHMLSRVMLIRRPGKSAVIRSMVEMFPRRTFVLIGDSGEKDPAIYAAVARRHPEQIAGIFIRQLADRPLDIGRCTKIFRGIRRDVWRLFSDPAEIIDQLPNLHVPNSNAAAF